jgi:hypothetical protein
MRTAPLAALAALAVLLAGCGGPGTKPLVSGPANAALGDPPGYAQVAESYNRRVEAMGSLWARAVIRVWFPDREGEERTEQVEGHFSFVRPSKVNLTLNKVNQVVAILGSNDAQYWWIEPARDPKKAYTGSHSKVDPDRVAELGLPVYPLDLIELVGITPLPTDPPASGQGSPVVRWAPGGALVVDFPMENGVRRLFLSPETYEPRRIEIADSGGNLVLSSDLTGYAPVAIRSGAPGVSHPRIPGEVLASVNQGRTRVRLRLYDAETGGRRPSPAAFDLDALLNAYPVQETIDLDAAPLARR